MPWLLAQKNQSTPEATNYALSFHHAYDITACSGELAVTPSHNDPSITSDALARISRLVKFLLAPGNFADFCLAVGDWEVKLTALKNDVVVIPVDSRANSQEEGQPGVYHLKSTEPGSDHYEIMLLREGDRVLFDSSSCRFSLEWDSTEVLVRSSVTPKDEIPESVDADEGDISDDNPLVNYLREDGVGEHFKRNGRDGRGSPTLTPRLSEAYGSMVEETPTAKRFVNVGDDKTDMHAMIQTPRPEEDTFHSDVFVHAAETVTESLGQTTNSMLLVMEAQEEIQIDLAVPESLNHVADTGSITQDKNADELLNGRGKATGLPSHREDSVDRENEGENRPLLVAESDTQGQTGKHEATVETRNEEITVDHEVAPSINSQASKHIVDMGEDETTDEEEEPTKEENASSDTGKGVKRATPTGEIDTPEPSPGPRRKRVKREDGSTQESGKSERRTKERGSFDNGNSMTPVVTTRSKKSLAEDAIVKPRVAFSNSGISQDDALKKFLTRHGGKVVENPNKDNFDVLCVKPGPLHKSMKVLLSVALGTPIVTDSWLQDSYTEGRFLSLEDYIPEVAGSEEEWGFSMSSIWSKPQAGLFEGKTLYFTQELAKTYKPFSQIQIVCKAVGAKQVKTPKQLKDFKVDADSIILGIEEDDQEAVALAKEGHTCYGRDLLTTSILRGTLDLESPEFKLAPTLSQEKKKKPASGGRGRRKKSVG